MFISFVEIFKSLELDCIKGRMKLFLILALMSLVYLSCAFSKVGSGASRRVVSKSASKSMTRMLSMSGGGGDEMKPFYALGVNVARQVGGELKGILSEKEIEAMLEGFSASMKNTVTDEVKMLQEYGPKLNEILSGRASMAIDTEKKKGKDFAASFLLKSPRAVIKPSGLIYNEILAGVGPQASPTSTVMVHYHGTLIDGTVFDSSVQRGEPIKFPLRNVIKGWQEGVAMMRQGSKATLVCPADIAYGDNGSPPVIPPGATLIFEVELIEVIA